MILEPPRAAPPPPKNGDEVMKFSQLTSELLNSCKIIYLYNNLTQAMIIKTLPLSRIIRKHYD